MLEIITWILIIISISIVCMIDLLGDEFRNNHKTSSDDIKSKPELDIRLHADKLSEIEDGDFLYSFKNKSFVGVIKVLNDAHDCLLSDKNILNADKYGWDHDYIKVSTTTYIECNDHQLIMDKDHFELYYNNIVEKVLRIYSSQILKPQCDSTVETIVEHIEYIEKNDPKHLLVEVRNQSLLLDKILQVIEYSNQQSLNSYKEAYNQTYSYLSDFWDQILPSSKNVSQIQQDKVTESPLRMKQK